MDDFFLAPSKKRGAQPARAQNGASRGAQSLRGGSRGGSAGGRGRGGRASKPAASQKRRREEDEPKDQHGEDSQDELGADAVSSEGSESEEEEKDPFADETPDEKRLRLAKDLIEKLRKPDLEESSVEDEDVAERIRLQTREKASLVQHKLQGVIITPNSIRACKNQHRLPVTSVCVAYDERSLFSASKDSNIVHWDVETCKKLHMFKGKHKGGDGHNGPVLAIATSTDGKLLASGGDDNAIRIWDLTSHRLIGKLGSHRDTVSGLAFRIGSHQLFSASFDRAVKVWNVDDMTEVETLYGHQAEITALDCLSKERFVTSGRDATARLWKVVEETRIDFEHHGGASLDTVAMLAEDHYVTGSQDGSIELWNITKKRPLHKIENAHSKPGQAAAGWVASLGALRYSDVFASGACDGALRLWQWDSIAKQIRPLCTAPVEGVVNSISFARTGRFVVAGVGRDHRLGRWFSSPEGDNSVKIIPLPIAVRAETK